MLSNKRAWALSAYAHRSKSFTLAKHLSYVECVENEGMNVCWHVSRFNFKRIHQ